MSFASVSPPLASPGRWMVREPAQKGVLPTASPAPPLGCPACRAGPQNLASQIKAAFPLWALSRLAPSTFQGEGGGQENVPDMVRKGPKAEDTLHHRGPSFRPRARDGEADTRPRPRKGQLPTHAPAPASLHLRPYGCS